MGPVTWVAGGPPRAKWQEINGFHCFFCSSFIRIFKDMGNGMRIVWEAYDFWGSHYRIITNSIKMMTSRSTSKSQTMLRILLHRDRHDRRLTALRL